MREPSPVPGTVLPAAGGEADVDTVGCLRRAQAEARHMGFRQTVLDMRLFAIVNDRAVLGFA
ncbi:hypothetical protein [Streptomyces sp. NPDC053431]|uniref:hypothetical protein n=1 Tax=Streptomyces sp. NPDC053431 TaxID=3365703 RepID=UPI0037CE1EF2